MFRTQVAGRAAQLRIQFVALDLGRLRTRSSRGTPGDPAIPPEMLAADGPERRRPAPRRRPSLVERTDGVTLGKPFEVVARGLPLPGRPDRDARGAFPTLAGRRGHSRSPRASRCRRSTPRRQLAPTSLLLDAPDEPACAAIRPRSTALAPAATVDGRAAFAQAFTDSPVTAAIVAGIAIAALVAAVYAALAVTAALALAGAARATEVAHLRMLGLSRRRRARARGRSSTGRPWSSRSSPASALGLGLFVLLEPGLGLDAIVGSQIEVPLTADPQQLAIIFAGILAIAASGSGWRPGCSGAGWPSPPSGAGSSRVDR